MGKSKPELYVIGAAWQLSNSVLPLVIVEHQVEKKDGKVRWGSVPGTHIASVGKKEEGKPPSFTNGVENWRNTTDCANANLPVKTGGDPLVFWEYEGFLFMLSGGGGG